MILIASAAYVNSEFQVEFGRLPPTFLPVGNVRLFERQIESLRRSFASESIYLTLPNSYDVPPKDLHYLNRNEVTILRSDEHLCLSDSIAHALDLIGGPIKNLRLLHGDTLVSDFPAVLDVVGVVQTNDDYDWEVEWSDVRSESVWCGYFAFSDVKMFRDQLLLTKRGFSEAVKLYDLLLPMRRLNINHWYDFGHINTYFQSRACLTTERAFNSLVIRDGCVRKTGKPVEKIVAEADWYRNLPPVLHIFCPQFLGAGWDSDGNPFYSLEYLPLPPLNEVFVHGNKSVLFWSKIFDLCNDFMARCHEQPLSEDKVTFVGISAARLVQDKTYERLRDFFKQTNFLDPDTSLSINGHAVPKLGAIVQECLNNLKNTSSVFGISHGDFCLSNILFDSRSNRIKVIDPRGMDSLGKLTTVGDLRYDLAKLTHSIVGLYDHIIAGAFDVRAEKVASVYEFYLEIHVDERIQSIQETFLSRTYIGSLKPQHVMPLTVLLFISMLPLHVENPQRQLALLANALRLYNAHMNNFTLS